MNAALLAHPPTHVQPALEDEVVHAPYCPAALVHTAEAASKKQRAHATDHHSALSPSGASSSSSSSSHAPSFSDLASNACVCAMSTSLASRVRVNPSFTRLFGFREVDVAAGMQREGMSWIRNLRPASQWMSEHMEFVAHCSELIKFVGGMAIIAARQLAGLPIEGGCLDQLIAPPSLQTGDENLQTKRGLVDLRTFRKLIRIQTSDGVQNPSAVIITWTLTGELMQPGQSSFRVCSQPKEADRSSQGTNGDHGTRDR